MLVDDAAAVVVAVFAGVLGVSVARACADPSRKMESALVLQDFQVAFARYLGYQTASLSTGELALELEDILEVLRISSVEVARQLAEDSSVDLASSRALRRSESDSRSDDLVADATGDADLVEDAAVARGCSASSASVQLLRPEH